MSRRDSLISFGSSFFDRFFEDDFPEVFPVLTVGHFPERKLKADMRVRTDIKETDTEYIVEAELPGFAKEDIDVSIDKGILTISAETKNETEDKSDNYVRKERYSGKYVRSYSFDKVDEDKISAKYDNGILTVMIPKMEEKVTKRGISVE